MRRRPHAARRGRVAVAASAALVTVVAVAAACGGPATDAADTRHVVEWEPHPLEGPAPPLDRGVGVVYFARLPGTARAPVTDSLAVLADTSPAADTVALFLLRETTPHAYRYAVASRDSLTPNVVEFDYEIAGLPMDTLSAGGAWARVVVGFARDGRPRTGWAPVRDAQARVLLWRERLPEQSLHFAEGVAPDFRDRPDGDVLAVALGDSAAADSLGYSMQPLEVRGDWMRVRVTVPHECRVIDARTAVQVEAWIRFVDARGRPRVWYSPRGC